MMCRSGAGGAHHQVMFLSVCISGHRAPERIPQALARQGQEQRPVAAGIDVCMAGIPGLPFFTGGTHDEVRLAVTVDVARSRDVISEQLVGTARSKREQYMAIPTRIHKSNARSCGAARSDIRNAIAI